MTPGAFAQIFLRTVLIGLSCNWFGASKAFSQRPAVAVDVFDRVRETISHRDFAEMQGSHERNRNFQIPPVLRQGSFMTSPACLQLGFKPERRNYSRKMAEFVLR